MKTLLACLSIIAWTVSGCHKTTYTRGPADPLTKENPSYHHIILSLVEVSHPLPIHKICEYELNRVDIRENFLTGLIGVATYGIYSPQMTFVQCQKGSPVLEAAE